LVFNENKNNIKCDENIKMWSCVKGAQDQIHKKKLFGEGFQWGKLKRVGNARQSLVEKNCMTIPLKLR
jgi:hypothetical protein